MAVVYTSQRDFKSSVIIGDNNSASLTNGQRSPITSGGDPQRREWWRHPALSWTAGIAGSVAAGLILFYAFHIGG